MYANFVSTNTICKTYSDQTETFIIQSSRGNSYIFILYDYESNYILYKPIKNRQAKYTADTWKIYYIHLKNNGHAPDLHILDKKCSDLLKSSFHKSNIGFQREPPHSHCCNAAERAIQNWKTTSSLDLPHVTPITPQQNGNTSCHSAIWQSTYLDHLADNQIFHPAPASSGITTSTEILAPPSEPK